MAGSGTTVLVSDVNDPRSIGVNLMGTGSGTRGYGQATFGQNTAAVSTSTLITPNQYNNIRYDLLNASAHQNGSATALTLAAETSGSIIDSTNASAVIAYASTVDANRLTAHSSRITTSSSFNGMSSSNSRSASWASSVQFTFSQNFVNADTARFFYNSGGKLRMSSSRSGGASSQQNTSWSNLLSAAGTLTFGASNFYGLTSSYQTFYSTTAGSPYASNQWLVETVCNIGNNVNGGATQITFRITWIDPYSDPSPGNPPAPEDIVDGTLSINFDHQYTSGGAVLTPSGSWAGFGNGGLSMPTYSVITNMSGG